MSMSIEEHDYIGLSETTMEKKGCVIKNSNKDLNLKATELRLGLPGSESPEREVVNGGGSKNSVAGAKRGFSDTIHGGSGKWVFAGNGGPEVDLVKNGGSVKETAVLVSTKPVLLEKRTQVSVKSNGQTSAPAPK